MAPKRKLNKTETPKQAVADSKIKAKMNSASSASSGSNSHSESDSYTNLGKLPVEAMQMTKKPKLKHQTEIQPRVFKSPEKKLEKGETSKAGQAKGRRIEVPSRFWAEGDAETILQGMVDFREKTGVPASSDLPGFHEFLLGFLETVATKEQLRNKMQDLKRKYLDGRPMCEEALGLSQQLWGEGAVSLGQRSVPAESSDGLKFSIEKAKLKIGELNDVLHRFTTMLNQH